MSKNVTIKDVAIEAGVSVGTVDRVIHKRGRYSRQTELSVKKAIETLNYTPSRIASALVNMKKHIKIGVNYPAIFSDNEFSLEIEHGVRAAQNELEAFGVEIIISNCHSLTEHSQRDSIRLLLEQGVDSIVTMAFDNDSTHVYLREYIPDNIPFATVTNASWREGSLFHVGPDDTALGTLMARLVSLYLPAANIAILAPNYDIENTQKRIRGFMRGISEQYPQINVSQIYPLTLGPYKSILDSLTEKTREIIHSSPAPDAIYITNGMMDESARIIEECSSPVSLFGHEYFARLPYYLDKGIIKVSLYQHTALLWKHAIKKMFLYLSGQDYTQEAVPVECSILVRESLPFIHIGL